MDTPTVPTLVLFAWFQGSLGFIFSDTTTLALAETDKHAGTGSAFLGFLQFALAAAVSPLVGLWGEDTAAPMAGLMIGSIALAVLAFVARTCANTDTGAPATDTPKQSAPEPVAQQAFPLTPAQTRSGGHASADRTGARPAIMRTVFFGRTQNSAGGHRAAALRGGS